MKIIAIGEKQKPSIFRTAIDSLNKDFSDQQEIATAIARSVKCEFDALLAVGFNEDQALQLSIARIRK